MRIALVSDAWTPQVNGVVRTLTTTLARLAARGHDVTTIVPSDFRTLPCPGYGEIRLALAPGRAVARRLGEAMPDAVHIATEGPLGWAARRWCLSQGLPFTTSFHTRFADYLAVRTHLPAELFWTTLDRFHRPAARVFVATPTLEKELAGRGYARLHRWGRGVDLSSFTPAGERHPEIAAMAGPVLLHVGRVAPEKNIEAFLALDVPGTKVVVGDGPARAGLEQRYPQARFLGALHGPPLAAAYRSADVLVFPSRTDTFGLVMAEALASGTPVAAYPVAGPVDVVTDAAIGALDEDLAAAVTRALACDRAACAAAGRLFDWERCTDQFLAGLSPVMAERLAA
ncbi:GDP-mannose-dependent alpha-mannosyltransferase [Sphingomonas metalli]|uniref:GDP-mannose-dependent alpha-mannosyltransferase n=1 Tax=Sphingomonas metalli TaxID=1779358 RepID=A0A916SUU6_9SPHN|nr:glycosyltransferase family 1 protein [Sphingomonas metalli]GGB19052.1 GDP-mannose-dependent alpha-mannosyltransferase [Sphingomonas metalli]